MSQRISLRHLARRAVQLAALAIASLGAAAAQAAPCAGFTDVDSVTVGPSFCANVEWIKNRGVTLGCTSTTLYCPNDSVTRLQMAAFMNRLGTALTPVQLASEASPGAVDLDVPPVVCQTTSLDVVNFPRTAYADVSFSGAASAPTTFAAELVFSLDAGATWNNLNANPVRTSAPTSGYGNATDIGSRDLAVGESVRFGVRISRGGVAGGTDITDSRCQLRVLVYSRTGATSPF